MNILDLQKRIAEKQDLTVIDVRSQDEIKNGIIPGAKWISLSGSAQDFMGKILSLPREKPYCVYCASGGRSEMVVSFMHENGFTNVENLDGGISSWLAGGNQTEKSI